jgi:hypothetical protein
MAGFGDFLFGSEPQYEQVSNLTPGQQRVQGNLERAVRKKGAGGAFGDTADYYRNLLKENPEMFEQMFQELQAPEMRRYREEIIPDLAEQFAGMGSGGLSSSGFRNAAVGAGTDLSERLGAIRANLRQNRDVLKMQGAQGLQNLGTQALTPNSTYQQTSAGSQGLLSPVLSAAGTALGTAAGNMGGQFLQNKFGTTSPYGNSGGLSSSGRQLPNFGG